MKDEREKGKGWSRTNAITRRVAIDNGFPGLFRKSTLSAAMRLEELIAQKIPIRKGERWLRTMTRRGRLHYWHTVEDWKTKLKERRQVFKETGVLIPIAGHERWCHPKPKKTKAQYQLKKWKKWEDKFGGSVME